MLYSVSPRAAIASDGQAVLLVSWCRPLRMGTPDTAILDPCRRCRSTPGHEQANKNAAAILFFTINHLINVLHVDNDKNNQGHDSPTYPFYPAMQGRFGTRTRQADQSGQKVHALAPPDQHACHGWQQGNADDARGPGKYLQGNRQESGQHQYPERRPWALRRNDLQFGHLGINASQPPQRIEQRANSGKREVPEGAGKPMPRARKRPC